MIDLILSTYKTFSDSTISKIEYFQQGENNFTSKICCVYMNSYNWDKDIFENIILIFEKVILFNFKETENTSSLNVTDALLTYENSIITLDFFPHQFSNCSLQVNLHSDFLIKSEKIELKVIE